MKGLRSGKGLAGPMLGFVTHTQTHEDMDMQNMTDLIYYKQTWYHFDDALVQIDPS